MERVVIGDNEYFFSKGYKDDEKLRKSFNKLAQDTFCIDYEEWYKRGYWKNRYIPYSIIDKDKVVANVSVNIIYFNILGVEKLCDHRGKGLSRFLIKKAIAEWKEKSDMIYLFANDSALDFYPKFGFEKEKEYIFYKLINYALCKNDNCNKDSEQKQEYKTLNMENKEERDFLYKKIMSSAVNLKLSMIKGTDLAMFYCISFMKDNIYYFKDIDTIAICETKGNTLFIYEVYSEEKIDLDCIIKRFAEEKINRVIIGFTPDDSSLYENELYREDDTTLFILEGSNVFRENRIKFELLSHA